MFPSARTSTDHGERAFTLIELLVVIAIIIVLASVGVTAFNSIGQARGVTEAANQVSSAVELARSEAVSRQTYVWLSLMNQTNSGSSDLRIGLVYSLDGTTNTNSTNFAPIAKPRLIQSVTLAGLAGSAGGKGGVGFVSALNPGSNFVTTSLIDLSKSNGVTYSIGRVAFTAPSVTFTPRG